MTENNNLGNSQNEQGNVGNTSSQSITVEHTGKHILQEWIEIFSNVDKTVLFTPDRYFHDLGFADRCPSLYEAMQNVMQHIGSFNIMLHSGNLNISWSGLTENQFVPVELKQLKPRTFFKYRSQEEQQLLLTFKTMGNSERPNRIYRDALPFSNERLASFLGIFNLPYPERRSYQILPFFIMLGITSGSGANVGYNKVGLAVLAADFHSNNQPATSQQYCVLTDRLDPNDEPYWNHLAYWAQNVMGRPLCLVLTDQAAINTPMTPVLGQAWQAPPNDFILRQWQFLDEDDSKMILCLGYQYFSRWGGTPQDAVNGLNTTSIYWEIPHYDFIDHLFWYLAGGKNQARRETFTNIWVADDIGYLTSLIWNMTYWRKTDYYARGIYDLGYTNTECTIYFPFWRNAHTYNRVYWNQIFVRKWSWPGFFPLFSGTQTKFSYYIRNGPIQLNQHSFILPSGNAYFYFPHQKVDGIPMCPVAVRGDSLDDDMNQTTGAAPYNWLSVSVYRDVERYEQPLEPWSHTTQNLGIYPYFSYISKIEANTINKGPFLRMTLNRPGWIVNNQFEPLYAGGVEVLDQQPEGAGFSFLG